MMAPVGKVIIRRTVPGDASGIARVCAEGWRDTTFKAIANTGGAVLGLRPLELDGLLAEIPGYAVGAVHRVWGWQTIANHAEDLLVRGE
jgi:hypothetical protein